MTHDCHVGRVRRQWLSHGAPGTSYGCPTGHIGRPRVVQWDTWDVHWTSIGRPTCPLDVPLVLWDVPLDAWDVVGRPMGCSGLPLAAPSAFNGTYIPRANMATRCNIPIATHETHLFVIIKAGGGGNQSVGCVKRFLWVAHGMGVFGRVAHAHVEGR